MASSDTKSGFRLPWNSDRAHDDAAPEGAEAAADAQAEPTTDDLEWPDSDIHARLGISTNGQRPPEEAAPDAAATDAAATETQDPEESQRMVEIEAPAAPAAAPKKPSKLMADLSAAIRATASSARDQALQQVDADAKQVTEAIREGATEGAATLRKRSDDDIAGIRDWSKAEIARIREETDNRIAARKGLLEGELSSHAASVNNRVEEVQFEVDRFKADMDEYFDRLSNESDPSRLATMVEAMPDLPSFEAWADVDTLADIAPADAVVMDEADEAQAVEAEVVEAAVEVDDAPVAMAAEAEPVEAEAEAMIEDAPVEEVAEATAALEADEVTAEDDGSIEVEATDDDETPATGKAVDWGEGDGDWSTSGEAGEDDVPRWTAGETPEGFPTGGEGGDPVDRGAIMAALEAAAEAVVAAEAAADSADQAEAAADVAETAAELVVGRNSAEDGTLDPEAQAALDARVDAGGFEESYTDRLAHLIPAGENAPGDNEPRTTQVVVSGLVSVASIASFKRHLGRLAGVQGVAVASGPEGEFVFNVTHRADVSFKDSIPTMPGFAARVTGTSDGVVAVAARDPESEN
jgi:hypothetical protein